MSHTPVVSVIIPTYNHAHFLREALVSLRAQTYPDWEAVVINNFSDDDTVAVVESFADSRMILENFRNNGNISASRNRGIKLARGRYVAFLDSDDTWYPEKLAKCMTHFDNGVGLVCHGLRWFGGQEKDMYCGPKQRATFDALLNNGNCITPSATVVVKDLLESVGCFSVNPKFITAEDYHLWIKLAQVGNKMYFIKEILGQYRIHSGNQSGSVMRQLNAELHVFNEFLPEENSYSLGKKVRVRRRFGIAYYGAGRAMQRNDKFEESWKLLFRGVAYWPFFLKSYVAILFGLVGTARKWQKRK
jgi:glycosyltransferase involved in cell wall biosynthesis